MFVDAGENTPESLNPSGVVNAEEEEEEGGLPSIPLDEGAFLLAPPGMELSDQVYICFSFLSNSSLLF
jgi:hypothetical protein